jgi:hypothetical protein
LNAEAVNCAGSEDGELAIHTGGAQPSRTLLEHTGNASGLIGGAPLTVRPRTAELAELAWSEGLKFCHLTYEGGDGCNEPCDACYQTALNRLIVDGRRMRQYENQQVQPCDRQVRTAPARSFPDQAARGSFATQRMPSPDGEMTARLFRKPCPVKHVIFSRRGD